jgi:hypothetical protein
LKDARILALATALAALAVAPPVAAQYRGTAPLKSRFHLGRLGLAPQLELLYAGRDSNVFLDTTYRQDDTSMVLRGSLDGFYPVGKRVRLFGTGWLDWNYYGTFTTQSSLDPGGEGRAELDLGHFTLMGGGGGFQARQRYTIDIDQRVLREERYGYGGAEWRLTRKLSLSGGAEGRTYRYDSSSRTASGNLQAAASLNRNSLTGRVDLHYRLTSMTTAVASAEVIEDEFQVSAPGLSTTRSFRYLAGVTTARKALISGSLLVGLRDLPARSSGSLPAYRGPTYQGTLAMRLFNRGRLTGTLLRDVFVSATPALTADDRARNAYVMLSTTVGLDWDLPLKLVGGATLGFTEADYILPTLVSGVRFPRVDHLYSAGGTLMRRFTESIRVGGSVTFYRRVSTLPGNSYERWTYGVSAVFVP